MAVNTIENSSEKIMSKSKLLEVKLASLLEMTKAINSNEKIPELISIYESILRYKLNVGKLVIYINDGGWKSILNYGMEATFTSEEVEKHLLPIKDITLMDFSPADLFGSIQKALKKYNVEVVIPVFHKEVPLAFVLTGDLDEDEIGMGASVRHLNFIQTLTNILIVAIENKRLAKEGIRQAEMRKELDVASRMQQMLFPSELPNDEQLEMHAYYIAHQQIGGDYYDFIRINDREVAICIADVSGKGISAALLMSNFQANMHSMLHRSESLAELVHDLNSIVNNTTKGERFITLFVAKYNIETKLFTYVNAGHNPPILISKQGVVSLLKVGCTGLGMIDDLEKVREGVVHIESDSIFFCYTDGVVEQENNEGEEFGLNRIKDILTKHKSSSSVEEINKIVVESVKDHKGTKQYLDDIAILTCRIH